MRARFWRFCLAVILLLPAIGHGRQAHAPKGGTYVNGKFYKGGQFLPEGASGDFVGMSHQADPPPNPLLEYAVRKEARRRARVAARTSARGMVLPSVPDHDPTPAPRGDQRTDEEKAAQLLRLGQALEDRKQKAAALRYYEEIVENYPGVPQAKVAADRIAALK